MHRNYAQSIFILITTTICFTLGQQQQQQGQPPPRHPGPIQIPPYLLHGPQQGPNNGKLVLQPSQHQQQLLQQQQQQQQRFIPSQHDHRQQQQHQHGPNAAQPSTAAQQQIHRISAPPQPQQHFPQKPPPPPPKYSSPPNHQNRINDPPSPPKYKQQQQSVKPQQQQKPKPPPPRQSNEDLEEYYDDEEENSGPDKLTLLLQNSKFTCGSKKDGYYADDSLDCTVFHYCQDGKKHSWMCPEGFGFHQIHLICLPPSTSNICAKSQSYHFINDYLYRPINEKEAAATNTSLRYADRYYPEDMNGEYTDENNPPVQPKPQQVQAHRQFNNFINRNSNNNNFYNSPESVNIPLNYRTRNVVNAQQINRDSSGGGGGGGGGQSKEQHSSEYDY